MNSASRRLLPVHLAAFLQGFVFWYVVDKLLATSVGLNATNLSLVLSAQAAMTVLMETPSGILADRWSRKGVMLLSVVFFTISTLSGAFATSSWHYLLIALGWGAFYAMYSGVYEAIVYDILIEENGSAQDFEKQFAKIGRNDGIALILGSLLGGVLAEKYGIHAPFWATLPVIGLTLIIILKIREPRLHKAETEARLLHHTKETFRAAVSSAVMVSLFLVSAFLGAMIRLGFEFAQIWYIQLGLPVALFGVFNASVLAALAVRGWLVGKINVDRFQLLFGLLVAAVIASLSLKISNPYLAAAGVTLTMLCILSAGLVLIGLQHNRLPSRIRAGAASVFGTIGQLVFIPFGISLGILTDRFGINRASWFMTAIIVLATWFAWRAKRAAAVERA